MRLYDSSGAVVRIPNSACFEVNLPGAEPGIVCPRAVWEQTMPAKIPLMFRSFVASTLCSRHARHFLTPCIGDSSGHFRHFQGVVGRGNYLSVFGCCIIACPATVIVWQMPWAHLYHLPTCWAVGPGRWRCALPFAPNEGPCYEQSCWETEGAVKPGTTPLVCGLRPFTACSVVSRI